ncbi:1198_t:CDS:2 [Entrophospora sp. SA101]|nr:1198_t:CDS:2 [Entrophospora sp. SA101]
MNDDNDLITFWMNQFLIKSMPVKISAHALNSALETKYGNVILLYDGPTLRQGGQAPNTLSNANMRI